MANILTHAARHAKAELLAAGIEVGHAKLQEVMAALLGYHTYRALKLEEDDQELEQHLSDAEFIVLDQELGQCRAAELFELPGEVLPKCIAALEECLPAQILPSVVELQKTNVLLTHEKAGRSGLVLRGVKPVEDITAVLEVTRVDQLVQRDDGSAVRPWVAVVFHKTSGTVLGSAVSFADNPEGVEVDALTDALDSAVHDDNDGVNGTNGYHIFQLDVNHDFTSTRLQQMALEAGIDIIPRSNRPNQMAGRMEAIFNKISKSMTIKQARLHARKPISDVEIMSTEEFEQLFKKS
ncbi:hypothetical protein [Pseudomonas monteilii]|uniref:hypothetical protein n=1 Tax=Pseudomonas monteilii TaxID=76759 RepID=UPI001E64B85D|nr:hypothetical protein [Pseudomonas monteilii]MCE1007784.1 hypothetical protein [Pseudomonas monteilii]